MFEQMATGKPPRFGCACETLAQIAHRKKNGLLHDGKLGEIAIGDELVVFPHEICPVDGIVIDGQGKMNEAYLTGEPLEMSKTPGAEVLSGSIIIIKNPAVLEQIDQSQTLIFDQTGTLTYGKPALSQALCAPGFQTNEVLGLAASLEVYSKHPLAGAILEAARSILVMC